MYYVSTTDIEKCINRKSYIDKNNPIKKKYKEKEGVEKKFVELFTGIKLNIKINGSYKQFEKVKVKYIFEHFINDIRNIILRINENIKIFEKNIENERRPNKLPTEKYLIDIKVKELLSNFKKYLINLKFRILVSKLLFLRVYKSYERPKSNSVEDYHKIKLREYIAEECNNICELCDHELDDDCTYEHIHPLSHGGATSYENGAVVHRLCNEKLGTLPEERKRRMLLLSNRNRDPNYGFNGDFDGDSNDDFADDFDYDFDDY